MSRYSSISDDTLLGFLLFALPDAEQWRIESLAFSDPKLRQRIEDLRDLLGPMSDLSHPVEPPVNLTASTMAFIEQACQANKQTPNPSAAGMSQPLFESNRFTKLAWIDSFVALAAGIVLLTLLLPSVWYSRDASRRFSCTSNLRELGLAFSVFAQSDAKQRIPKIEVDGPLSFAGVYTMRLQGKGLLPSPKWIWCPAIECFDPSQAIPTIPVFLAGSPKQQQGWRFTIGGSYFYNLGNIVDGEYETPSYKGQSYFAVLGDSLLQINADEEVAAVHGANIANVLYEDGRIQSIHVSQKNAVSMIDNPYFNREMKQAVGHGLDDSCLGPSFQNPFRPVKLE